MRLNSITNFITKVIDSRLFLVVLLLLTASLIGSYVYLINNSVFMIVAREDDLEKITLMETELAALETRYLELSSRISLALAYELGFQDASRETVFVKLDEASNRLSLVDNEI